MLNFFSLYDVESLPFFGAFKFPYFTFFAIWLIPALAFILGYLVFRNRIKEYIFQLYSSCSLVFYNGINSQRNYKWNQFVQHQIQNFSVICWRPYNTKVLFLFDGNIIIIKLFICKWLVSKNSKDSSCHKRWRSRVRFSGYNPVVYKTIFYCCWILAGISGALFTVQADLISPQYLLPFQ